MAERLEAVQARLEEAARAADRAPEDVTLIGVTKGQPLAAVTEAVAAGLGDLGENHVQELERRRPLAPRVRWHHLGRVQSNKARRVALVADLVHGLEPGRAAERLAAAALERGTSLRVLLEVDFTGRRQGVAPAGVGAAVEALRLLAGLDLAGLMTVAPPGPADAARRAFSELRDLRDQHAPELPDLSMGMSDDFPVAIAEGATMVRIGTAIFGPRPIDEET